jgi:glutamate-1-semialdehyde 2,1-aminomutase
VKPEPKPSLNPASSPFHNMALMCPATTDADADAHTAVFAAAADDLLS